MAHDERLAARIRALLEGRAGVSEMRMFGGLGFMIEGKMAVAASGKGGMLVRVDPEQAGELVEEPVVEPMVMRGRPMSGWLRVEGSILGDEEALAAWVDRGVDRAASLPSKD